MLPAYGLKLCTWDITFFRKALQLFILPYFRLLWWCYWVFSLFLSLLIIIKTPCLGDQTGRRPNSAGPFLMEIGGITVGIKAWFYWFLRLEFISRTWCDWCRSYSFISIPNRDESRELRGLSVFVGWQYLDRQLVSLCTRTDGLHHHPR
jgi:hypothetical protein